jgi:hypothetical protein
MPDGWSLRHLHSSLIRQESNGSLVHMRYTCSALADTCSLVDKGIPLGASVLVCFPDGATATYVCHSHSARHKVPSCLISLHLCRGKRHLSVIIIQQRLNKVPSCLISLHMWRGKPLLCVCRQSSFVAATIVTLPHCASHC